MAARLFRKTQTCCLSRSFGTKQINATEMCLTDYLTLKAYINMENKKCILCGFEEGNGIGKVQFIMRNDICEICCNGLYADNENELENIEENTDYDY